MAQSSEFRIGTFAKFCRAWGGRRIWVVKVSKNSINSLLKNGTAIRNKAIIEHSGPLSSR
jgi:hypothetical protein